MTKFKSSARALTHPPTDDAPHGPGNFMDRAKLYVAQHGGEWHVIRSLRSSSPGGATPAQWLAWVEWFRRHGFNVRCMEDVGTRTVPAKWPEDFDPRADPSDFGATFPSPAYVSPARHREIHEELKALAARMGASIARRANNRVQQTPGEVLADMASAYSNMPAPVASDRLLSTVAGTPPRRIEPEVADDDLEF